MKKISFGLFFISILAGLAAQDLSEYDTGYIASVKNNRCFRVSEYPGKDVKPSTLLKDQLCKIISVDETIKSLLIACTDNAANKTVIYPYRMTLESCGESLEAVKKRLK